MNLQKEVYTPKELTAEQPDSLDIGAHYSKVFKAINEEIKFVDDATNKMKEFSAKAEQAQERGKALTIKSAKLKIKESEVAEALEAATTKRGAAQIKLDSFPTLADDFAGFAPSPLHTVLTDAEGKFSFTYPRTTPYAIFARTDRMVGTKTEQFCWLVNAPGDSDTATVLLSNHDLIFDDPDQLLKIKPKRTIEISQ
jgi:hypothetical protein